MTTQANNLNMELSAAQPDIEQDRLRHELDVFLREAQPRAFRMLMYALHDEQQALDILQDAMLAFVRSYAKRPPAERAPLFYRVVQNRLRDHFRRQKTRGRWLSFFGELGGQKDAQTSYEPEATAAEPQVWQQMDTQHKMEYLDRALGRLGLRQQQTFLLRAWEGLSEAQTAAALGISVGSVKTHYARARAALQAALGTLEMAEVET